MPHKTKKSIRAVPKVPRRERDAWNTIVDAVTNVPRYGKQPADWAHPPWRKWQSAAQLCHALWLKHRRMQPLEIDRISNALTDIIMHGMTDPEDYWRVGDWRNTVPQIYVDPPAAQALETALAITQLGIAKSDGGGTAFVERLGNLFEAFSAKLIDIEVDVMQARQRDVLGVAADPRLVDAFRAAWALGHFRLACAL